MSKLLLLLLLLVLLLAPATSADCTDSLYNYIIEEKNYSHPYQWGEVSVFVKPPCLDLHQALLLRQVPRPSVFDASYFVPQPVYVSLTTMASRLDKVNTTIARLVQGKIKPTQIYLFVSKDPFLLDAGVNIVPDYLLSLAAASHVTIVFTNNLGPHRKLLPALRRHWGEDVFIATVDDDMEKDKGTTLLYLLLKTYTNGGSDAVVALRTRRMGLCLESSHRLMRYGYWIITAAYGKTEMLNLPTGTGGILYQPRFFHEIVFSKTLRELTGTADDIMFRLAAMVNNIPVRLGCSKWWHRNRVIRRCKEDKTDRLYDERVKEVMENRGIVPINRQGGEGGEGEGQGKRRPRVRQGGQEEREGQGSLREQEEQGGWSFEPANRVGRQLELQIITGDFITPDNKTLDNKTLPRNGAKYMKARESDQDLFTMNRRGGNDRAMSGALAFLQKKRLLNFYKIVQANFAERGSRCANFTESMMKQRFCSVYSCEDGGISSRRKEKTEVAAQRAAVEKLVFPKT